MENSISGTKKLRKNKSLKKTEKIFSTYYQPCPTNLPHRENTSNKNTNQTNLLLQDNINFLNNTLHNIKQISFMNINEKIVDVKYLKSDLFVIICLNSFYLHRVKKDEELILHYTLPPEKTNSKNRIKRIFLHENKLPPSQIQSEKEIKEVKENGLMRIYSPEILIVVLYSSEIKLFNLNSGNTHSELEIYELKIDLPFTLDDLLVNEKIETELNQNLIVENQKISDVLMYNKLDFLLSYKNKNFNLLSNSNSSLSSSINYDANNQYFQVLSLLIKAFNLIIIPCNLKNEGLRSSINSITKSKKQSTEENKNNKTEKRFLSEKSK